MTVEMTGTYAGAVWTALAEGGCDSLKTIKKATKLKEKEIYAALGWLAREGKVQLNEVEDCKDLGVALL